MRAWSLLVLMVCVVALGEPPASQPALENGAKAYREAFELEANLTDSAKESIAGWDTVALDGQTEKVIREATAALDALHRGAAAGKCDWEIDYSKGFMALLRHLSPGRTSVQLLCLRARSRLATGDSAGAAQDLADAMQLATDIGNQGVGVAVMVRQGAQTFVARFITANASKFTKADAGVMLPKLQGHDCRRDVKQAVLKEKDLMLISLRIMTPADWKNIKIDVAAVEELRKHPDELAQAFVDVAAAADGTPEAADKAAQDARDRLTKAGAPADRFIPSMSRALTKTIETQQALADAEKALGAR